MNARGKRMRVLLPILVVLVGLASAMVLIRARPRVQTRVAEVPPPLVRVMTVRPQTVELEVHGQGTVEPRTETTVVSEVVGRVVQVNHAFVTGGFFDRNDVLVRIDPTDYELAVVRARAVVAQAEVRLAREEAETEVARQEWQKLGAGEGSPLVTRELQLLEARAGLEASRAGLQQAEVQLQRTSVRAPFSGRVRRKAVDVGQFVTPGQVMGALYATDLAEIRVPLPDEELAHFDLPSATRGTPSRDELPRVTLAARYAGADHEWEGRVVRTEGEIDPRTRMLNVVVQVDDPFGRRSQSKAAPLAPGLFVQATIHGRRTEGLFVLPRAAMRGRDQVLVVDDDDRLRFRTVGVLRAERDVVLIRTGLRDGERVCLSPLAAVTDGMRIRTQVVEDAPPLVDDAPPETPLGVVRSP